MSANELTALLWREREVLETVLFKLEEERMVLLSGRTRWLSRATSESLAIAKKAAELSLARTVEASALGVEWGAGDNPTLNELIACAPDHAWRDILTQHREALLALAEQIGLARDENARILNAAIRATHEASSAAGNTVTYDSRGRNTDTSPATSALVDKEL